MIIKMSAMKKGSVGKIVCNNSSGEMRKRLTDLGFTKGTDVICVAESPLGDPVAFLIKGSVIALRYEDMKNITVEISDKGGDR